MDHLDKIHEEHMNIGIDIKSAVGNKAGIGYYTKSLVQALSAIDKENNYFLFSTADIDWHLGENFKTIVYPYSGLINKLLWHLKTLWMVQFSNKIDVFFSPNSLTIPMLSFFKRNNVLSVMDLVPYKMSKTAELKVRLLFAQMPLALKMSKSLVAISEATKNDLVEYMKVDPKKITVTPLAAHDWCYEETTEEEINRVQKKYYLPEKYFLFVSTLEPRKNIPNLIRAFAKFSKADKQNFKLVIGGKKGWLYDEIFQVVKDEEVEDKIIFTDYIADEDMLPLYKGATAFTFISWMEGFGLTPLEAMAVGLPVLCSNTSSLPEVVGDAAILVSPESVEQIAEDMRQLAEDEKLRKELIEKGKLQASKFSWEKTAKLTLEVLEKV